MHKMTQDQLNLGLRIAANEGDIEDVKEALQRGANIRSSDFDGWTPIHHAAHEGHTEVAKFLIRKEADVNAITIFGHTPLDFAVDGGHTETAELLKQHGGV